MEHELGRRDDVVFECRGGTDEGCRSIVLLAKVSVVATSTFTSASSMQLIGHSTADVVHSDILCIIP